MSAHTPGPWAIHEHMGGEHETDCREDHGFIAHTIPIGAGETLIGELCAFQFEPGRSNGGYPRVSSFDENRANARLIAAAPDLLAALIELDERLRKCSPEPISAAEAYDSFYQDIVSEAIAKATGRPS